MVARSHARSGRATAEWLIADQGRLSSVEDLYRLSLNPAKQFTAHNLEFRDEDLKLTLADGSVFVADTDQGTTALVLVGRGDMSFHPAPETEKSQVKIFSGADGIDTRFDAAYLRINPGDFDRLISSRQLVSRPVDQNDFRAADRIFREDFPKSYGLELGDLSRDTWSLLPRPARSRRRNPYATIQHVDVLALLFLTGGHQPVRSKQSQDDRAVFVAAQRPAGCVARERGRAPISRCGTTTSTCRRRRTGAGSRAALDCRFEWDASPISSLTLRLAEPLVVQSVVSDEYGRLFNMRVKDQNSVVVSLPNTAVSAAPS